MKVLEMSSNLWTGSQANEFLRNSYVLPQEECEDRSLFSLYQMTDKTKRGENLPSSRLVEEEENEKCFGPPALSQRGYNLFIAPARNLLEEPVIIVIPHPQFRLHR